MIRHFGVLIPSTNTTVEIEYNRLLPPTLQGHVGRLGKGDHTPFSPSQPDDIAYQARCPFRKSRASPFGVDNV